MNAPQSKINGEDVLDDAYELLIAKLKAAPRPLCIHFLGVLPPLPAGVHTATAAPVSMGMGQFTNVNYAPGAAAVGAQPAAYVPQYQQPLPSAPPASAALQQPGPPANGGGGMFGLL